jgi:serine/threonine-protein kinase
VRGKHKGIFTQDTSRIFELSATNNFVKLTIGALGEISVSYDNFDFIVASVSGSVYINNIRAQPGAKLHEACVLTFGDTSLGAYREWVTFSSSHPEVIL